MPTACPLCGERKAQSLPTNTRTVYIACVSCGEYKISSEANDDLGANEFLRFKLACWVSQQAQFGIQPMIKTDTVEWMKTHPIPGIQKRAELYLGKVIASLEGLLIGIFFCTDRRFQVASWSFRDSDCVAIARYLTDLGALETPPAGAREGAFMLNAKGHLLYEQMVGQRATGSQAFVAMWFNTELAEAYREGIEPAVRAAGYEPLRIDQSNHANKIDDQIIAEIRRSAFVVADFTGHRGGVYYEAGFAHGLAKQVIFTCRNDALADLHFDVRQYNTIVWRDVLQLRDELQNRLLAIFGAGPQNLNAKPVPLATG